MRKCGLTAPCWAPGRPGVKQGLVSAASLGADFYPFYPFRCRTLVMGDGCLVQPCFSAGPSSSLLLFSLPTAQLVTDTPIHLPTNLLPTIHHNPSIIHPPVISLPMNLFTNHPLSSISLPIHYSSFTQIQTFICPPSSLNNPSPCYCHHSSIPSSMSPSIICH